jgi:hypothetical protein
LLVRYLMPSSPALQQSLGRCHLWRLFADLCRVDDEFERVGILVLLHQFEVDEPFRISYRNAAREPISGRFEQRGCKFIFAVSGQALYRLSQVSGRVLLTKSVVRLEDVLADPDYDQRFPRGMGWRGCWAYRCCARVISRLALTENNVLRLHI